MIMNDDISYEILDNIKDVKSLQEFCKVNKTNYNLCKQYDTLLAKHLLNVYDVNYKDPNNFIYKYNKEDINKYIQGKSLIIKRYFYYI